MTKNRRNNMNSMSGGSSLFTAGGESQTIKNGFNHLNDLFSEFTKHISPAFHHERPERSVQMRLYTMHKGQFLLIFIMFLCLFFIALLMGMAGPKIITQHVETASKLNPSAASMPRGPFLIVTPTLNSYRRQLWIYAQISFKDKDLTTSFSKRSFVSCGVSGIESPDKTTYIGGKNLSRLIHCNENECEPFIIIHMGVLEYSHLLVNVTFSSDLDSHYQKISDIFFTITTYNPSFTKMEILFRLFFVLVTLIVIIITIFSLRKFSLYDWSIEQKWTFLLLPLLLGFNNPLFPWSIMSSNLIPAILDAVFQSSFLFALLLFWLCVFHGLRQTERGLVKFYLPKLILVGGLWFSGTTMAILEEINEIRDPTFSHQLNTAHYKNFQLLFTGSLAIYVVYILYLMLRAFGELRSLNYLDSRLKFHAGSMSLVLILTIAILSSRYGSGILEDNFIARLYTSYESEGQFLAYYTVINCYILVLAYVYTPTTSQTREAHLMRDNPAFSMINESDEEIEAMLVPEDKNNTHLGILTDGDSD